MPVEHGQDDELRVELETHHVDAFGWAQSCCGWERTVAEDVLQTAYGKILEGKAVFSGRSSFKTWLFAVIRRTAAEERRRLTVRKFVTLEGVIGRLRSLAEPSDAQIVRSEETERLVAALRELPKRQRAVLHLVFYENLTIREAAELLGISLGTARTHYERGKGRLRELLQEDLGS